ncbi:MAG TPA: alanine racemase [Candidatus Limnocylindrales bacterium]|nr:alanine racemase [Candidatus Limnocylindrales bacterium]
MTAEPLPADEPGRPRGRPRGRNEVIRNGTVAGLDPEALAARFGTPLYVYDLDVVERQVRSLAAVLPPSVDLAYAVKANPALGVVAHVGSLGLGADVASGGELETALAAGVRTDRIVFTGPGKRDEELRLAVRREIRAITVESLGELDRLASIAQAEGRRARVLLRAAVSRAARLERVRLVGDDGAGKFGLGPDELRVAAERAVRSPHLEPLGLHAFGASNVLDAGALADHVATTVAAAAALARDTGFPLRLVDVGGGIGIPYESHEESFDLVGFGRRMAELVAAWTCDPVLGDIRLLLEPGRFLVGPAGAYLARVVDRKTLDGRDVVIVDGGIHHLVRPALVGQEHRVRRFGSPSAGPARFAPVTIAGPLCSGLDVLATEAMIRTPEVGDLVAVLDVGAYGFTESMPFFLSHPLPAEVAVRGRQAALLRPRLEPATVLGWQRLPAWTGEDGGTG